MGAPSPAHHDPLQTAAAAVSASNSSSTHFMGNLGGGEVDESRPGYFIPVTVVDNPPESSMIVQQEQFGPIVPIIAYDDVDDVVARANDSPFGLGGSVWGRDTQAAVAVANRLETGMVWVNEIHTQGVDIPFGGHKQSGIGTEHGHEGRLLFTNPKTVLIKK